MKHSVCSRVACICGALAVVSVVVWAAPTTKARDQIKPNLLVVGQSSKTTAKTVPQGLARMKRVALSNNEKVNLLKVAGFVAPDGIITKAQFTPSQPTIPKQGLINVENALYWASGSPTDNSYTGYVQMKGGKGNIDIGFIPFLSNKPVLVVFNIGTQIGETAFELSAGEQTQKMVLQSANHNISCVVAPTTTDMQWVTLKCTGGSDWAFYFVEVTVLK